MQIFCKFVILPKLKNYTMTLKLISEEKRKRKPVWIVFLGICLGFESCSVLHCQLPSFLTHHYQYIINTIIIINTNLTESEHTHGFLKQMLVLVVRTWALNPTTVLAWTWICHLPALEAGSHFIQAIALYSRRHHLHRKQSEWCSLWLWRTPTLIQSFWTSVSIFVDWGE